MSNNIGTVGRSLLFKKILGVFLFHPLMGKLIGLIWANRIPHKGSRIEVPKMQARVNAMLFWGAYESAEIRFVQRYLGGDLDVVELGSSLGVVACEIAKKLAGKRKLICVEANEQIFQILRRNVLSNAPNQEVHFAQGAIDYSGNATVEFAIGDSNLSSHVNDSKEQDAPNMNNQVVQAVTLSGLLETHGIGDYVLISDIEGAEIGLFVHDLQAFAHCRRIIIELHDTSNGDEKYTVQALIELIQKNTNMLMRDRYGPVCVFEKQNLNRKVW
jgi:FkbM family methyltransferase